MKDLHQKLIQKYLREKNRYHIIALVFTFFVFTFAYSFFNPGATPFRNVTKAANVSYYISPDGSDENAGTSEKPLATFTKAVSAMSGGDTLIIKDGTYNQRLANPPSGTADRYTIVKAEHDGKALIENSADSVVSVGTSYVQVEGIDVRTTSKSGAIVSVKGGNHVKMLRFSAFRKGGTASYPSGVSIDANDVLLEDCAVAGGARYVVAVGNSSGDSNNVVVRRCVIRWDYQSVNSPPARGGFMVYGPKSGTGTVSNISFQNVIVLDNNDAQGFSTDGAYENLDVYGSIALNIKGQQGFGGSQGKGQPRQYKENVAWDVSGYGFGLWGLIGNIDQATMGDTNGIYSFNGGSFSNSLFINNSGKLDTHPSYSYNWFYNNFSLPLGDNYLTSDPGIKYIPRTPDTGTGEGGKKRGATIEKKYGVSGTLRGEAGWATLTSESLWPWPNEDRWKKIICQENPAEAGSFPGTNEWDRGFCKTESLTKYIWEYLGNPCPTDICSGAPPTPDILKPSIPANLAATAVSDSQINLTWNASTDNVGVIGYKIYRGGVQVGISSTLSYSDKGLSASTTYAYAVSVYDAAGNNSNLSASVSANTKDSIAPPPVGECVKANVLCVDDTVGSTQEYSTIQAAAVVVKAGDTVIVYEGTYVGFQITTSGTQTSPIVFKNSGAVTINTDGPTGDGIRLENVSYVTVDGFKIENTSARCIAARGATPTSPMKTVTLKNNNCSNSTREGFYLSELSDSLIENNSIINSGNGAGVSNHGIYLANAGSDNTVIKNNIISKSNGQGIHVNGDLSVGGDGIVSGLRIENNIIRGNNPNGFNFDGVQDSLIQNNIVYGNVRHAFRGYDRDGASGPKNLKIINNTFLVPSTGGWPMKLSEDGGGHVIFNNILLNESANGSIVVGNTSFTSNYNIFKDKFSVNGETSTITFSQWQAQGYDANSKIATLSEVFASPTSNDYHLKNLSKAIDAGISSVAAVLAPLKDQEGSKRPQGTTFDSGAYEKAGTAPPPVDTTPPSGTVVVNNGVSAANSIFVTLTLSATDTESGMGNGAQMQFSNDNTNWSAAEPYATTKNWTLGSEDGIKTVYVKFKDVAGNWIASPASDTITLDQIGPVISNIEITNLAFNSMTIAWQTNESSTGQIEYGIGASGEYTFSSPVNPALTSSHSQTIVGLTPDTVYHARVRSKDVLNNQSFSSDQVFTTPFKYKKSDLNKDKKVDQFDFDTLKQDFDRTDGSVADMNSDGIVNAIDLGIMMSEWD